MSRHHHTRSAAHQSLGKSPSTSDASDVPQSPVSSTNAPQPEASSSAAQASAVMSAHHEHSLVVGPSSVSPVSGLQSPNEPVSRPSPSTSPVSSVSHRLVSGLSPRDDPFVANLPNSNLSDSRVPRGSAAPSSPRRAPTHSAVPTTSLSHAAIPPALAAPTSSSVRASTAASSSKPGNSHPMTNDKSIAKSSLPPLIRDSPPQPESSPLLIKVELDRVRAIIAQQIPLRRDDEQIHDWFSRRRHTILGWYGRPREVTESDDIYRQREELYELIALALPHLEQQERSLSNASRQVQSIHHTIPPRSSRSVHLTPHSSRVSREDTARALKYSSSPRAAPSAPSRELTELDERLHRHHDQGRYLIDHYLRRYIDVPEESKGVADVLRKTKLSLPSPYAGAANAESYLQWVCQLTSWCNFMNIVGPKYDSRRVQLIGSCLSSVASDWYYTEVSTPLLSGAQWTFQSVLHALYDRFIPRSTRVQAIRDFEECAYSAEDGAQGLRARLKVIATRLPSNPDSYTMARRFVAALPKHVFDHITAVQGLSAEYSTAAELIAGAEDAENAFRIIKDHDLQLYDPSSMPSATTAISDDRHDLIPSSSDSTLRVMLSPYASTDRLSVASDSASSFSDDSTASATSPHEYPVADATLNTSHEDSDAQSDLKYDDG